MPRPTEEQLDKLRAWLLRRRDEYYEDRATVPDELFDKREDVFRKYRPTDSYFKRVGSKVTAVGKEKIKLPYAMLSLDKVRVDRGLERWLEQAVGVITASDKIDGSSIGIENVNGKLRAFTRGNGTVGRDITHLLPHMKGVGQIPRGECVRGEAAMDETDFQKYWKGEGYDDNRGLVNGAINSGKISKTLKHIQFIAHGMLYPRMPWAKARVKLKQLGFTTAETITLRNPAPAQLNKLYTERKAKSKFNIDGLVLENTQGQQVAFKVEDESILARVVKVEWQITRLGIITPVVHIVRYEE